MVVGYRTEYRGYHDAEREWTGADGAWPERGVEIVIPTRWIAVWMVVVVSTIIAIAALIGCLA